MRRGKLQRTLASVLPLVVATLLMLGCAPRARHAFLEFFIDGVPPYRTPEERVRLELEQAAQDAQAEEEARKQASRRHKAVKKLARFTHGPFAAKECARCHDLGAASGFRGERGGGATSAASLGDLAEGGRLRFPVVELCVRCHTGYEPAALGDDGSFVHGPVASGWCVVCHESHSSFEPSLVRTAPAARLCGQCHVREDLVAFTPEHRPADPEEGFPPLASAAEDVGNGTEPPATAVVQVVRDCTRCHDPHRGPTRALLRVPRRLAPQHEWDAGPKLPGSGGGS